MNIYVPKAYYDKKSIDGYTLKTAPIFMPNSVGGYCPGKTENPSESKAILTALRHGFIVASPAIRGRTLKNRNKNNHGKAPACIVDYKAAVGFLHKFADILPGDDNKIITNGTSAGGALSCLIGVTGNHLDYKEHLREIGAAEEDDSIFASSCYCPITNLGNADAAYEWQFDGIYDYCKSRILTPKSDKNINSLLKRTMNEERIKISKEECALFTTYINSLNLKDEDGKPLTLDENENGTFKEYIKSVILSSAQEVLDKGVDLTGKKWLDVCGGKAVAMDFYGYAKDITRMKTASAFDDITMTSTENNLFGDKYNDYAHFTKYSTCHSTANGKTAQKKIIKMLNPMYYIEDEKAESAKYFRIRHGERDRDTSIAISAILSLKLKEIGCNVDYAAPWDIPHSGDYDLDEYDLDELFAWINKIVKEG
ncbi:MAG: alpha/beta hydrolase [Clostridiales bacterium]|nr:alpha/beta hydrolase [Clostridiales bacterium]